MASEGVKYALPTREKKDVQKVQGVFGSHTFLTEEQVNTVPTSTSSHIVGECNRTDTS